MAAGAITATRVRRTAVEFSYPNFFTHIGYYTKKPFPLSKVFAIFWPYDKIIWLTLAGTLPAFCLTYWFTSKIHRNGFSQTFSIGAAAMQTGQILIMKGKERKYKMIQSIIIIFSSYNSMASHLERQDFCANLDVVCYGFIIRYD